MQMKVGKWWVSWWEIGFPASSTGIHARPLYLFERATKAGGGRLCFQLCSECLCGFSPASSHTQLLKVNWRQWTVWACLYAAWWAVQDVAHPSPRCVGSDDWQGDWEGWISATLLPPAHAQKLMLHLCLLQRYENAAGSLVWLLMQYSR